MHVIHILTQRPRALTNTKAQTHKTKQKTILPRASGASAAGGSAAGAAAGDGGQRGSRSPAGNGEEGARVQQMGGNMMTISKQV